MDAEQTVREFMAAVTADITAAEEMMDADFSVTGMSPAPIDRREFLTIHDGFNRAMPDRRFILSEVHSEGKTVSALVGMRGTHTGVLNAPIPGVEPIQPTYKQVDLPPTPMRFTLHDGKVAGIDAAPPPGGGLMGLLQQLGVRVPG